MDIANTLRHANDHARIRNTRIPVWTLVSFRKQGADEAELLRNYPSITPDDLNAAWNYYKQHREAIDRVIASHHYEEEYGSPLLQ